MFLQDTHSVEYNLSKVANLSKENMEYGIRPDSVIVLSCLVSMRQIKLLSLYTHWHKMFACSSSSVLHRT